jgi:hypothetical protein
MDLLRGTIEVAETYSVGDLALKIFETREYTQNWKTN